MSLLSIVQDACRELSVPILTSVVGNDTTNAPMFLQLAKDELNSLATRCEWQVLTKENTFTATATSVQVTASAVPTDFDHMCNESIYNRTSRRKVYGPVSAKQWQDMQAHVQSAIDPLYRLRGGTILMYPSPTSGDTIAYEYISNQKAKSSGGNAQENWQADNDTCVFREDIVTRGLVWRYKRAKGYVYTADLEEYERRVVEAIMRDGTKSRLSTDAPCEYVRPQAPLTPDTLVGL